MKERPILFNGAMVRAILAGAKTQTRRVAKAFEGMEGLDEILRRFPRQHGCPFGQPGDRLWVRESYADLRGTGIEHRPDPAGPMQRYAYAADTPAGTAGDYQRKDYGIKWRPSIHMPREACRLLLQITDVRVERLLAISEADAEAEGIERFATVGGTAWKDYSGGDGFSTRDLNSRRRSFESLWTSTGGDWAGNPWVWVIKFKQVTT